MLETSSLKILVGSFVGILTIICIALPLILKTKRNMVPISKEFDGIIVDKVRMFREVGVGTSKKTITSYKYLIHYKKNGRIYTYSTSSNGQVSKQHEVKDYCKVYLNKKNRLYSSID